MKNRYRHIVLSITLFSPSLLLRMNNITFTGLHDKLDRLPKPSQPHSIAVHILPGKVPLSLSTEGCSKCWIVSWVVDFSRILTLTEKIEWSDGLKMFAKNKIVPVSKFLEMKTFWFEKFDRIFCKLHCFVLIKPSTCLFHIWYCEDCTNVAFVLRVLFWGNLPYR